MAVKGRHNFSRWDESRSERWDSSASTASTKANYGPKKKEFNSDWRIRGILSWRYIFCLLKHFTESVQYIILCLSQAHASLDLRTIKKVHSHQYCPLELPQPLETSLEQIYLIVIIAKNKEYSTALDSYFLAYVWWTFTHSSLPQVPTQQPSWSLNYILHVKGINVKKNKSKRIGSQWHPWKSVKSASVSKWLILILCHCNQLNFILRVITRELQKLSV